MIRPVWKWFTIVLCSTLLSSCNFVLAADTPANVEGTRKISVSGEAEMPSRPLC